MITPTLVYTRRCRVMIVAGKHGGIKTLQRKLKYLMDITSL